MKRRVVMQFPIAALWLAMPSAIPAMTTTLGNQSLTWSISGFEDSSLVFESRQETSTTVTETYRAPCLVGRSVSISASFPKVAIQTNTIPVQRNLAAGIPVGRFLVRSELQWTPDCGLPDDLELQHADTFSPNRIYDFIAVEAFAVDLNTNGTAGPTRQILVKIYPTAKYWVTNEEWLKGLPRYEDRKNRKPQGSGACSAMGLPTWSISSSACNLLIEDTDFACAAPGLGLRVKRYYNADPTVIGMFGRSWSFEYEESIDAAPLGARLRKGTGQVLTYTVGDLAINTNYVEAAPMPGNEDIVIITITNRLAPVVGRFTLSDYVYPTNWNGTLVPPPGETDWMTYRQETNRHVYELREKATRWTRRYEGTNANAEYNWLTSITDLNSNRLDIQRNDAGRITNIADSVGRTVLFQYNPAGYCTNMTVPGGGRAAFTYDGNGNLLSSRDLAGNVSQYRYDTNHLITNIVSGSATWIVRWSEGFVEHLVTPTGFTNTFYRQPTPATNRWTWHLDAHGRQTQYLSDFGRTLRVLAPDGYERRTVYDTNGLPVAVTNESGFTRRLRYDGHRNLIAASDFTGATNRYAYSTNDWLLAVTNPLGQVYRYEYDARGNLTNAILPSGRRYRMTHDDQGLLTSLADPAGNTCLLTYNSLGRLSTFTDPAGYSTRLGYDAAGIERTAVTNARGYVTRFEYDANRRLVKTTFPDGSTVSNEYDCCAEVRVTDEEGRAWSVQRDELLNVTHRTDPMGRVTRYTYDRLPSLASITNALGRGHSASNDFRGRPLGILNTYGDLTRFSRNAEGRVAMLYPTTNLYKDFIWWVEPQYQFTYDGEGRVTADTSRRSTYTRDTLGRITNRRNGRAQDIGYTYDEDGRLATKTYSGALVFSNTYDQAGRLANTRDSTGTTTFSRDARGLVSGITWPDGLSVSFQYDQNGHESAITYPGGPTVEVQRDSRDRVTNLFWNGGSLGFTLDRAGLVRLTRMGNGAQAAFSFDANRRITNITHSSATTNILTLRYQRDLLGQTTNIVKTAGVAPWSPLMTPTNMSAGHDAYFAFTNWNAGQPTYDADKNLTALTGDRALYATYDPDNRATSIVANGTTRTYVYDGASRRVRITANGAVRSLHLDHRDRLLFETDSAGTVNARYVYRGQRLVALLDASGAHYYHFDARGSTLAMTDSAGNISALYRYLPYGAVAGGYSRAANPFTFVGEYGVMDDGYGLFFMTTRFYDAVLRRFLSRDSIGAKGGLNLYEYAVGNPMDFIDSTGTWPSDYIEWGYTAYQSSDAAALEWLQGYIVQREEKQGAASDARCRAEPRRPLTAEEQAAFDSILEFGDPPPEGWEAWEASEEERVPSDPTSTEDVSQRSSPPQHGEIHVIQVGSDIFEIVEEP